MADLQTKNFSTLVAEQVTAIQGASTALVDFTIGSILRAIVEAYAAIALWLQALVLQVLALTRAATSTGADLDSWMADFGLIRLDATAATGQVTFSRFTDTTRAVVPVGAVVQTADGTEQYLVIADTTNAAYSTADGGYVIPAGVASVTASVQAVNDGSAGNAAIGAINTIGQAIVGVDTVTNVAAFDNGQDAETDTAFRARFVNYLASLSRATKAAVNYATTSVQNGVTNVLVENENLDGTARLGFFYDVIDDGSGDPPDSLVSTVYAAVDAVRPISVNFAIFKPSVLTATVVMSVQVASGYAPATVASAVEDTISAFIQDLPLGASLPWARLISVAFNVAGVNDVSNYLLNGGTADIAAASNEKIQAGLITVAGAN